MKFRTRVEVIPKEEYNRIHEGSLRLLEEMGVVFEWDEAVEICKKAGLKTEGKTVFFTRKVVEDALASVPKQYEWQAINPERNVTVGDGFILQPPFGAVYVQEPDGTRRKGTLADYRDFQIICQALPSVKATGSLPITPCDTTPEERYLQMMYHNFKHTDKPTIGTITTYERANQVLDLIELAVGKKLGENEYYCSAAINPLSPLKWSPESCQTMIAYAKRRQPMFYLPCAMTGATSPISLMGTAAMQNAEILSGFTFANLISPGMPGVYGPSSSTAYMKTASYVTGTPEMMLMNNINLQMGREFYQVPTRTMCGMCSAKIVDAQAGFETMQNLLMGMLGGAQILNECIGILDEIMSVSFPKIIIDHEMVERVIRIWEGVYAQDFDTDLCIDLIKEVGHYGTYLTHEDTFAHYRDRWTPSISTWDSYTAWEKAGAEDIVTRADKKCKEILAEAPAMLCDPALDQEMQAFLKKTLG